MKYLKALLAMLAVTAAGFAQNNAPASPDAAKLALARDVIHAMQVDKMFDQMKAQMKQMATQAASSAMPANATPEQRAQAEALQGKIMDLSMEAARDMIAKMDALYADVYSEAELNAMKAFFTSSEGKSMLAKQPMLMQRVMPLAQSMQMELMPKIQKLVEEAKAAATPAAAPVETPAAKTTEAAK